jgi:hypothetical protein
MTTTLVNITEPSELASPHSFVGADRMILAHDRYSFVTRARHRECAGRRKNRASAGLFLNSGGGIRTRDLWVMSPTSYQTAPPRVAIPSSSKEPARAARAGGRSHRRSPPGCVAKGRVGEDQLVVEQVEWETGDARADVLAGLAAGRRPVEHARHRRNLLRAATTSYGVYTRPR